MSKISNYSKIYDVFISYRREGGETMAILLHDRLTAKGYNVFLDVESLNSGGFNSQLLTVIENCKDVIVVLAKDSLERCANEDDWVRKELAHAFKHEKNIVPFMLRGFEWGCPLPEEIAALPLQNGVNANSNEYFDASIERLITKFLKSEPTEITVKPSRPGLKIAGGAVAACVFVGAIVFVVTQFFTGSEPPTPPTPPNSGVPHQPGQPTTSQIAEPKPIGYYSDRQINRTIAGANYGIVAVKADGTVVSYGIKEDLSGWTDIVSVSVGSDHILGLKSDGTVVSMGDNRFNQCSVSNWKDIIAIDAGMFQSIGVRSDGTVISVGQMFDYHKEVSELRDVIAIETGMHHVVALKADGSVVVFGNDSYGESQTSGWSGITAIAANDFFTMGVKADGSIEYTGDNVWGHDPDYYDGSEMWCKDLADWDNIAELWVGENGSDIVGLRKDGTVVVSKGRVGESQVIAGWTDIVAVTVSYRNIIGVKSDGTVVCTKWMTFDTLADELSKWNGIKVE